MNNNWETIGFVNGKRINGSSNEMLILFVKNIQGTLFYKAHLNFTDYHVSPNQFFGRAGYQSSCYTHYIVDDDGKEIYFSI